MKIILIMLIGSLAVAMIFGKTHHSSEVEIKPIKLPSPVLESDVSVEEALSVRRSVREYKDEALTLAHISQLLWAAQGITSAGGYRTAPSAGALYPLELYLVAGNVEGLSPGVYKYYPHKHSIALVLDGDKRKDLARVSVLQTWMARAPVFLVMGAVYRRTTVKYGPRGKRYVHIEVGHAAQNVYLQAASMKLGTVIVGAFVDQAVKNIVGLKKTEEPLAIMPIGHPR